MTNATCGKTGFNYCKWAKILVAIPALPIIAISAASLVENPLVQVLAAAAAIGLTVAGSIWIDRQPLLQKKFRPCPKCDNAG